jgi:hypothetical protein
VIGSIHSRQIPKTCSPGSYSRLDLAGTEISDHA